MGVVVRGMAEFIRDLETLPERADKAFPKVLSKGALNIKTAWRKKWDGIKRPPTHIPHLVRGIGYDTTTKRPKYGATVGVIASNSQAPLAHLIEFGSVNNSPHPAGQESLDEEAPRFAQAVADVAVDLLDGEMTADLVDENHAQAGLNLLRAGGEITVYDGQVTSDVEPALGATLPYVLVYTTVKWPGDGAANALDAQAVTVVVEYNCHCVGETAAAARAMQMQARARLLNQRPVVAGRNCGLIQQDDVLAPNRDETTGRLVMDGVSTFSYLSAPG